MRKTDAPPGPQLAQALQRGTLDRRTFLALANSFAACARPGQARTTSRSGGTLRIAAHVPPLRDPRLFARIEAGNIARQFLDPLVRWDASRGFVPHLLSDWQMDVTARRLTLRLRAGVRWSNGDTLSNADLMHNLRRWCDSNIEGNVMATRLRALIDPGTGQMAADVITPEGDLTLHLTLPRPDITLISAMADYPALLVHRSHGDDSDLATDPIGTGPFALTGLTPNAEAILTRRDDAWGATPPLDKLQFLDLQSDEEAIAAAVEVGRIDVIGPASPQLSATVTGLGMIRQTTPTAGTLVARMRADTAPFTDIRLRRALQVAVDPDIVLQTALDGDGITAENHHVAPVHPAYAPLPPVAPDPAQAKALLLEAGLSDTTLTFTSPDQGWPRVAADVLADQWRAIGLTITRRTVPPSAYWNGWKDFAFSVTEWGARPLGTEVLSLAYRSDAAWNETRHNNPAFDVALDRALALWEPDKRRAEMATLQTLLRDSGVIIQPFWRNTAVHHAPSVHGLSPHPADELHLDTVWKSA